VASIYLSIKTLFKLSIHSGQIPAAWKVSNVTPIPKSSSSGTPSGYRPISLLLVLSKELERHSSLLDIYRTSHDPLSLQQRGFQSGKNTTSALIHITDHWLFEIEKNHEICAVFFNLQKALYSVPHQALLAELHSFGVDNFLLKWICHYLLDRKQHVVLKGACSEPSAVVSGFPQGSVLGPLLFLIYFDTITQIPFIIGLLHGHIC